MKYQGNSFSLAPSHRVTDAVITKERISLDWEEAGASGHLEASSTDGVRFKGTYGYRQPLPSRHIELTLFKSEGSGLALVCHWWNTENGNEGDWLFQLRPKSTAAPSDAEVDRLG